MGLKKPACAVVAVELLWDLCGDRCITTCCDGLVLPSLQDIQDDQLQPPQNSPLPDGPAAATSTPQPVPAAGSQAEKAVPNKSLLDWLRQQSDYTLDVPSFGTVRVAFGGMCVPVSALCAAFGVRLSVVALKFKAPMKYSKRSTFPCATGGSVCQAWVTLWGWAWFSVQSQSTC